jgi:hypothetical protein
LVGDSVQGEGRFGVKFRIQIVAVLLGSLGALAAFECPAGAQNLREWARTQAAENPGVPLHVTGSPGDYSLKTVEALANESNAVLRGRLTLIKSYLSADEERILTDYRIDIEELIAGDLPPITAKAPGNAPSPTVTAPGGDLEVEGILVRATDPNREPILSGGSYLLFLIPARGGRPNSFEIYHGGIFSVSEGRVTPLLRNGERLFNVRAGSSLQDVARSVNRPGRKGP